VIDGLLKWDPSERMNLEMALDKLELIYQTAKRKREGTI